MSDKLPGKGVFGWLGRQVGHVKKAVKTKPAASAPAKRSAPQSRGTAAAAKPASPKSDPPPAEAPVTGVGVLYRQGQVQEAEHPTQPGVKLRRTIIDEVIVDETRTPHDGKGGTR